MAHQHPPVGVFIGGFSVLESLQKAPFGGSWQIPKFFLAVCLQTLLKKMSTFK